MTPPVKSMIYAHRGANREAAENTRTAFNRALRYPIDGMETDIQLSLDGVAVLWHDWLLGKLGFPTKRIDDYDLSDLQSMNFAAHFSPDAKPEGIMSLREFIDDYRQRCRLLLEIKSRDGEDAERQQAKIRQTLELADRYRNGEPASDAIIASSFHLPSLIYAHQYSPDFPLVYNCESGQTVSDAERTLNAHPFLHGLCLHKNTLGKDMVDMLRSHDKSIAVYTCNSDAEIQRALDLVVDILISDLPQKALQMRDA
jgi:glycerophosphoryl diester phosphodiesterase